MKQLFAIVLVLVVACNLCACGRRPAETTPTTMPATTTVTTAPTTVTMPTMDPTIETNIPDPSVDTSMPGETDLMPTDEAATEYSGAATGPARSVK